MPPVPKAFAFDTAWMNAANNLNSSPVSIESKEPLEFLRGIRDQLKDNFPVFDEKTDQDKEGVNHDNIKHNICCIRALLTLNEDILSRCMNHAVSTGEETKLARFGFEGVRTNQEGNLLEIVTQAERATQTFDTTPLSKPPAGFSDIVVVKYRSPSNFIDFIDLFHKTLLLNDGALHYLLPMLKEHLEDAQVCLGKLDDWIMQPCRNVSFINNVFQKDYKTPDDVDFLRISEYECCFCGSSTLQHFVGTLALRTTPSPVSCTYDKCKQVHVISTGTVSGTLHDSFDLSQASDRARLLRLNYYVNGTMLTEHTECDEESLLTQKGDGLSNIEQVMAQPPQIEGRLCKNEDN